MLAGFASVDDDVIDAPVLLETCHIPGHQIGKREKLADVRFEGNQHFNNDQLAGHIALEKAHFLNRGKYSQELLKKSTNSLTALYRNDGYPDVTVTPRVLTHADNIEVVFYVVEGQQTTIRDLKIVNQNGEPMRPKVRPQSIRLEAGSAYSPFLLDNDRNRILLKPWNKPDARPDGPC